MFGTSSSLPCFKAEVARAEVASSEVPRQQSSAGSLARPGGEGVGWFGSSRCTSLRCGPRSSVWRCIEMTA